MDCSTGAVEFNLLPKFLEEVFRDRNQNQCAERVSHSTSVSTFM